MFDHDQNRDIDWWGGLRSLLRTSVLRSLMALVFLIVVWQVLAALRFIDTRLLPPPSSWLEEIIATRNLQIFKLGYAQQGNEFFIINSVFWSLVRVLSGIFIGFSCGFAVGLTISYFRLVEKTLLPVILLLAPISPIAWIPFAMILFGIGNKPAIFVVVVGVFFLITVATVSAVKNVSPDSIDSAKVLGASRYQIMKLVIVPEILPQVFLILRINSFAAWMAVLAAEMVGVSEGLGAMILVGRSLFNMRIIFVAMLLIGISGLILDLTLVFLQSRIIWWKRSSTY